LPQAGATSRRKSTNCFAIVGTFAARTQSRLLLYRFVVRAPTNRRRQYSDINLALIRNRRFLDTRFARGSLNLGPHLRGWRVAEIVRRTIVIIVPGMAIALSAIIIMRLPICRMATVASGAVTATFVAGTITAIITGITLVAPTARAAWTAIIVIVALILRVSLALITLALIALALRIALILRIVALIIVWTIILVVTLGVRLVLTDFVIIDDAEIMVGILQESFLLHAVTIMLRILRQLFILIQHLGRIAARPAVDPVQLVTSAATSALWAIIIAATATIIVTISIVIQGSVFPHSWPAAVKIYRRGHLN